MGDFSLYLRLDPADADADTATTILDPYVEAYEDVEYVPDPDAGEESGDVIVPEKGLDIAGLETYAELFEDLRKYPAVSHLKPWGPDSERFPVVVKHFALQQIPDPDLYEFHALDDEETLVVCESELELQQVQQAVPPTGRG